MCIVMAGYAHSFGSIEDGFNRKAEIWDRLAAYVPHPQGSSLSWLCHKSNIPTCTWACHGTKKQDCQIGQACSPLVKKTNIWDSIMELGRAYDSMMGLVLFLPIGFLSWFPFVSEFQTRLLFNQAFSRGLQISRILAGQKDFGDIELPIS